MQNLNWTVISKLMKHQYFELVFHYKHLNIVLFKGKRPRKDQFLNITGNSRKLKIQCHYTTSEFYTLTDCATACGTTDGLHCDWLGWCHKNWEKSMGDGGGEYCEIEYNPPNTGSRKKRLI
jgi:hypothetical protein